MTILFDSIPEGIFEEFGDKANWDHYGEAPTSECRTRLLVYRENRLVLDGEDYREINPNTKVELFISANRFVKTYYARGIWADDLYTIYGIVEVENAVPSW